MGTPNSARRHSRRDRAGGRCHLVRPEGPAAAGRQRCASVPRTLPRMSVSPPGPTRSSAQPPGGGGRGAGVGARRGPGAGAGVPGAAGGHRRGPADHRRGRRRSSLRALPQVSWDPYLDLEAGSCGTASASTDRRAAAPRRGRPHRGPPGPAGHAAHCPGTTTWRTCRRSTGSSSARSTTGRASCAPSRSARARCSARPSPAGRRRAVFARLARADHLRGRPRAAFVDGLTACSPRSTPCTRSARATAAPSVRSSASWPAPPGTRSAGRPWTRPANVAAAGPPTSTATPLRSCGLDRWSTQIVGRTLAGGDAGELPGRSTGQPGSRRNTARGRCRSTLISGRSWRGRPDQLLALAHRVHHHRRHRLGCGGQRRRLAALGHPGVHETGPHHRHPHPELAHRLGQPGVERVQPGLGRAVDEVRPPRPLPGHRGQRDQRHRAPAPSSARPAPPRPTPRRCS